MTPGIAFTWGEFKRAMEEAGVEDGDLIDWISTTQGERDFFMNLSVDVQGRRWVAVDTVPNPDYGHVPWKFSNLPEKHDADGDSKPKA